MSPQVYPVRPGLLLLQSPALTQDRHRLSGTSFTEQRESTGTSSRSAKPRPRSSSEATPLRARPGAALPSGTTRRTHRYTVSDTTRGCTMTRVEGSADRPLLPSVWRRWQGSVCCSLSGRCGRGVADDVSTVPLRMLRSHPGTRSGTPTADTRGCGVGRALGRRGPTRLPFLRFGLATNRLQVTPAAEAAGVVAAKRPPIGPGPQASGNECWATRPSAGRDRRSGSLACSHLGRTHRGTTGQRNASEHCGAGGNCVAGRGTLTRP